MGGRFEGLIEGTLVGRMLGDTLGICDGLLLGPADGKKLGAWVLVGAPDGAAVTEGAPLG